LTTPPNVFLNIVLLALIPTRSLSLIYFLRQAFVFATPRHVPSCATCHIGSCIFTTN
jgi:hypothetical protein